MLPAANAARCQCCQLHPTSQKSIFSETAKMTSKHNLFLQALAKLGSLSVNEMNHCFTFLGSLAIYSYNPIWPPHPQGTKASRLHIRHRYHFVFHRIVVGKNGLFMTDFVATYQLVILLYKLV